MNRQLVSSVVMATLLGAAGIAYAHMKQEDLPAGPIRDRHELMEGIGKNAKAIGDALKRGKHDPIAEAADKISAAASKIPALFPKGSTDPKSRAMPAIWEHWDKFEGLTKELGARASELAAAARSGGDVGGAAKKMFGNCKSCHDDFRKPEEKEDGKS